MAIEYRKATAADLPVLLELGRKFAEEQNQHWTFNKLASNFMLHVREAMKLAVEHPAAFVMVAADGEQVVGYILGQIGEPPPLFDPKAYVFVSDLYVREQYRRQGIGTGLVERLRSWGMVKGVYRMSLVISEGNPAMGIFRRLDFTPQERLLFWADPAYGGADYKLPGEEEH